MTLFADSQTWIKNRIRADEAIEMVAVKTNCRNPIELWYQIPIRQMSV